MTDIANGWSINKQIPLWRVLSLAIGLITAVVTASWAVGQISKSVETLTTDVRRVEKRVDIQEEAYRNVPERLRAVEVELRELKASNFRQERAFDDIKALIISTQNQKARAAVIRPQGRP